MKFSTRIAPPVGSGSGVIQGQGIYYFFWGGGGVDPCVTPITQTCAYMNMKHYCAKPLACCTRFASRPGTVLLASAMHNCMHYSWYSNHKKLHYTLLCNRNGRGVCQVSRISTHSLAVCSVMISRVIGPITHYSS